MKGSLIENKRMYQEAMDRVEELTKKVPAPGSPAGRELRLLIHLLQEYEDRVWVSGDLDPIDAIETRMEQLGLTASDLLDAFGDKGTASKVLNRQRGLSLHMIRVLSVRLSLPVALLIKPGHASAREQTLAAEPVLPYKRSAKKKASTR